MKKEELLKKLETYNKEYESAEEKLTSVKELWEEDFFKDNREELKELKELQKKYFEEKEKIVNEFRELQNQEGVEDETIVNKKREGRNALDKYKEVSKKINDLEQQHTKELSQLDEFEKSMEKIKEDISLKIKSVNRQLEEIELEENREQMLEETNKEIKKDEEEITISKQEYNELKNQINQLQEELKKSQQRFEKMLKESNKQLEKDFDKKLEVVEKKIEKRQNSFEKKIENRFESIEKSIDKEKEVLKLKNDLVVEDVKKLQSELTENLEEKINTRKDILLIKEKELTNKQKELKKKYVQLNGIERGFTDKDMNIISKDIEDLNSLDSKYMNNKMLKRDLENNFKKLEKDEQLFSNIHFPDKLNKFIEEWNKLVIEINWYEEMGIDNREEEVEYQEKKKQRTSIKNSITKSFNKYSSEIKEIQEQNIEQPQISSPNTQYNPQFKPTFHKS